MEKRFSKKRMTHCSKVQADFISPINLIEDDMCQHSWTVYKWHNGQSLIHSKRGSLRNICSICSRKEGSKARCRSTFFDWVVIQSSGTHCVTMSEGVCFGQRRRLWTSVESRKSLIVRQYFQDRIPTTFMNGPHTHIYLLFNSSAKIIRRMNWALVFRCQMV